MTTKPQQLTEPLDYPHGAVEKLCDALNAANDAYRAYLKSRNIKFEGNYFNVVEHKQRKSLTRAAHKYELDYLHNIIPMMLDTKPVGGIQ